MHRIGTLVGFCTAFLVYAIGVFQGNSLVSLLSRAGIAFLAAYFMILLFGLVVVFSSGHPGKSQPEETPPQQPADKKKPGPGQQQDAFSIPEK